MLVLWPLFLSQVPIALSSRVRSRGEEGEKLKERRMEEWAGETPFKVQKVLETVGEQLENQTSVTWYPDTLSEEAKGKLVLEQLTNKLQELGLRPKNEDTGSVSQQFRDPEKVTVMRIPKAIEICYSHTYYIKSIRSSERGHVLIVPHYDLPWTNTCNINGCRYSLFGGVFRVCDEERNRLFYSTFTANRDGISSDLPGIFQFASFHDVNPGVLPEHNNIFLPTSFKSLEDQGLNLSLECLVYRNVAPLESPYLIQHLNLHDSTLFKGVIDTLEKEIQVQPFIYNNIVWQGINLVQFIQLWNALEQEEDIESLELKKIQELLETVERGDIGKKDDLVVEASRLVYRNYNPDKDEAHRFLSILMEKDRKIRKAFFTGLGAVFDPEAKLEGQVCDKLENKLIFFVRSTHENGISPYLLKIPCADDPDKFATFRLVATFDNCGLMATYGIGMDPLELEHIVKESYYGYESRIEIINRPSTNPQDQLFWTKDRLSIYQHVWDRKRFARVRPPAPQ